MRQNIYLKFEVDTLGNNEVVTFFIKKSEYNGDIFDYFGAKIVNLITCDVIDDRTHVGIFVFEL
jgi:hypothetical protein